MATKSAPSRKPPRRSPAAAAPLQPQPGPESVAWRVARPLLLIALVAAAFHPVLGHEFIEGDDFLVLDDNPHYLPPRAEGLKAFWTQPQYQFYVPVTYTIWWVIAHVAYGTGPDGTPGLWPLPYHAANLVAHVASTLFLYLVLARLVRNAWAAWLAAALFALHPLHVEPVSWASTVYSVLSGTFALAATWAYLNFSDAHFGPPRAAPGGTRADADDDVGPPAAGGRRGPRWAWLAAFAVLYGLSLLTKPTVILLPVILAVIEVGVRGRPVRGVAAVTAAVLVAGALPMVAATLNAQPAAGVYSPLFLRPLIAADSLACYLWHAAWPLRSAPDYGRSPQWLMNEGSGALFTTWLVPLAVFAVAVGVWRRTRWPAVTFVVFALALAPVLGLARFDYQRFSTVADRYAYFALVAPAMLVAAALARRPSRALFGAVLVIAILLGVRSHAQTQYWHDTDRMFKFAMARNPDSFAAHTYEIRRLTRLGRENETLDHYRTSNRVYSDSPRMWFMHGRVALNNGLFDEAIDCLTRSANLAEPHSQIYAHLAVALARRGRTDDAVVAAGRAVAANPHDADAHLKAGVVFGSAGRYEEARHHFGKVIELRGDVAAAEQGLSQLKLLAKPGTPPASQPQ